MLHETHQRIPGRPVAPHGPSRKVGGTVSGLTLADAEGLLDWLEARGCTGLRASLGEDGAVSVFWAGGPAPAAGPAALL